VIRPDTPKIKFFGGKAEFLDGAGCHLYQEKSGANLGKINAKVDKVVFIIL
jgi:hypothetical protein